MKVLDALRSKPGGDALANRLQNEIRVRALDKLSHTKDLFPHFTDHTMKHGDGVVGILDWLLPDEAKKKLNEWELYFLVAAAYVHDIGMVEGCPESPAGPQWAEFLKQFRQEAAEEAGDSGDAQLRAKREYVRRHHHARSEEYIGKKWIELGLRASDTPAEGEIVGRIALGHRVVDLGDQTLFGEIPFRDKLIRRNLLAAYLRLADELDTTAHRTPWAEYEVLGLYDEKSALEWAKHLSISGVNAGQGIIVIAGTCHEHEVYVRLVKLQREIKGKLTELKRMLRRPYATGDGFYLEDPLPYHDVELKLEHEGYLPISIKFELQDEEITSLIMGERLYGDRTACIRELLQNATDTCREARELRPARWKGRIEVREEDDGKVIAMSDNGMGMDEAIVREYFARVGISYYRSPSFKGKFRPISEFGIGILSCFMMADRLEVESKRDGSEPIHLEIRSLSETFVPKRGSQTEAGTVVKLHLKEAAIGQFDLVERVRHFVRHPEFQITIRTVDGGVHKILDPGFVPSTEDLELPEWTRPRKLESVVRKAKGIELGVTLLPFGSSGSRLCQHGFLVGELSDEFAKIGSRTWCEVNLTGAATLPLTVDRTRAGQEMPGIWSQLSELYGQAVEQMFKKEKGAPWWRFHLQYYRDALEHIPQALLREARKRAEYCTMTRAGFKSRTVDAIVEWCGDVYAVERGDHGELERLRVSVPEDVLILVLPVNRGWWYYSHERSREKGWYVDLIDRPIIEEPARFLRRMGVKSRTYEINEQKRTFVDVGRALGMWRVSLRWIHGGATVFDLRHPFSQILTKRCRGRLPERSNLLLKELFRLAHTFGTAEVAKRQKEVVEALKEDGIASPEDALPPKSGRGTAGHECPYRGGR